MAAKPRSSKHCPTCDATKPAAQFGKNRSRPDGLSSQCLDCKSGKQRKVSGKRAAAADAEDERIIADRAAAVRRLSSDFAPLRVDDFDVSVGNDHSPGAAKLSAQASSQKRQEYSERMGEHAQQLAAAAKAHARGQGAIADHLSREQGAYTAGLAEQERRFGNRRVARTISLYDAGEALALAQFKIAAAEYLSDKIVPTGYARRAPTSARKRSVCVLLSDLHLGANLSSMDEPFPFGALQEARRLEWVLRQVLGFKPQHRRDTEAIVFLNGDVIEGQLGHDLRAGAPLVEQKMIFWRLLREFIAHVAAQFPSVRVICQPGNHGRDKVRHPGRATARKWDGHETELYLGLREMSSALANVTWQIDFRAASIVDVHGSTVGVTHGDTEIKLGNPDTMSTRNAQALDRINSTLVYGRRVDVWLLGHYHMPRWQPRSPGALWNGALIPPNGYARGEGYVGEPQGQWLWESVEGHPVGDLRFVRVGPDQDNDASLGTMIHPFRFDD